jgi:hypothetical protein
VSAASWASRRANNADAERRLSRMPVSETGRGAAVPFPFADRKVIHDRHSNREINEAISASGIRRVRLDSLHAIQHSVKPDRVDQYIRDPALRPPGDLHDRAHTPVDHPVVIRQDGKNYLWDGHHRATAKKLRGDKDVDARFVDFDKSR